MPGVPLQAGIAQAQEQRRQQGQDPLASTLDVFHTKHEARQALTIDWNQVERDWEAFEQAEDQLRRARRAGIHVRAAAGKASRAWVKVVKSFDHYEAIEAAWKHAEVALAVFRPDGQLNDRAWAQAQVAPALPALVGRAWVKGRQPLASPGELHVLGPNARRVGVDPGPPGTARCLGAALVAAPATAREIRRGVGHRCRACGPPGPAGDLPEVGSELARVVPTSGGGFAWYSACQQRGGVHEQRAADAPVAASNIDPRHARPEAVVLEHVGRFEVGSERASAPTSTWG